MLDVKLKVASGKHQGQVIPLTGRKFLIGREHDCQLRTNSDLVSRHHCVFSVDNYAVRLRDLGSTNGTLVNGERIREIVLKAGDRVQIGKLHFEMVVSERQVPEGTPPSAVAVDGAEGPEVRIESETVQLSADETQYELPSTAPAEPETQYELPVAGAEATGDTTILQQPPAQQPLGWPPGYPPPAGMYPQWPYGAPPPGQYYGYGAPYAAPGYPPQAQYPVYPPQYQPPPSPEPAGGAQVGQALVAPPVRLPPPEETGARAPAPPPVEAKSEKTDGTQQPPAMTPSQRAAEIIKQRTRRPG